ALHNGAFAIIPKPKLGGRDFLESAADDLAGIIRAAAASRIHKLMPSPPSAVEVRSRTENGKADAPRLVAIGSSTGGTQALEMILQALPRGCPGMVVVQHMHPELVQAFAENLNRSLVLNVKVAENGDRIQPGWVFLAPGESHLTVERDDLGWRCHLKEGPLVSKHCPSVDVLFRSVAKEAGSHATGFVLTGMGEDGARGLKEMREAGASTYAQDEESCVVFGMSKEAIKLGAAQRIVSLGEIPHIIAGYEV
ncbi:MAG: chemotaxis protein CheB, partial [Fibrobacterota bacterium]